jgi:hypothetical protein
MEMFLLPVNLASYTNQQQGFDGPNLLPNHSFEEGTGNLPDRWLSESYGSCELM